MGLIKAAINPRLMGHDRDYVYSPFLRFFEMDENRAHAFGCFLNVYCVDEAVSKTRSHTLPCRRIPHTGEQELGNLDSLLTSIINELQSSPNGNMNRTEHHRAAMNVRCKLPSRLSPM